MADAKREHRCEEYGAKFDIRTEEEFASHNFKIYPELQKFPR